MIYKVFYQESNERNPRREATKSLYLDIDTDSEIAGRIKAKELLEAKTPYHIEYVERLSDKAVAYEKESGAFELTEL